MLISLGIKNVVLIEKIHLDFTNGLTVFTGETGAGKSILLDSLSLALGNRADTKLIRTGEESLSVSATFSVEPDSPVLKILQDNDIEAEDEIILRRTLNISGKSRFFVNGEPVNAAFLKEIGEMLLEIHGQFSSVKLLNEAYHTEILDTFGGLCFDVQSVNNLFNLWQNAEKELIITEEQLSAAAKEQDYLRYVANEIELLNPQPDEATELEEKCTLMASSEKTAENLASAKHYLSSGNGAVQSLISAGRSLEKILQYLPNNEPFKQAAASIETAIAEAQEAENKLSAIDLNFDADELNAAQERLFALKDLARKHRVLPDELPAVLKDFQAKLHSLDEAENKLKILQQKVKQAKENFLAEAEILSKKRKNAAEKLDKEVAKELPFLKLGKAVFQTIVDTDASKAYGSGIDKIYFKVATNKGMDFGALSKIASGGELSRFMLALKIVLADTPFPAALVFDEIDTGISGSASAAVGNRLKKLSGFTQVLIVTHSPQIAAVADTHFFVQKSADNDKTVTVVKELTFNERIDKIAEMLSGNEVTAEAKAAAKSLLEEKDE